MHGEEVKVDVSCMPCMGKKLWGCLWGLPGEMGLQFGCWTAGCDEAGLLQAWPAVVGLKTLGLGPIKKETTINNNENDISK